MLLFMCLTISEVFAITKSEGIYIETDTKNLLPEFLHGSSFNITSLELQTLKKDSARDHKFTFMKEFGHENPFKSMLYSELNDEEKYNTIFNDYSELILRIESTSTPEKLETNLNDIILCITFLPCHQPNNFTLVHQPQEYPKLRKVYDFLLWNDLLDYASEIGLKNKNCFIQTLEALLKNDLMKFNFINPTSDPKFIFSLFDKIDSFCRSRDHHYSKINYDTTKKEIETHIYNTRGSNQEPSHSSFSPATFVEETTQQVSESFKPFFFDLYNIYSNCAARLKEEPSVIIRRDVLPSTCIQPIKCMIISFPKTNEYKNVFSSVTIALVSNNRLYQPIPYYFDEDSLKIILPYKNLYAISYDFTRILVTYQLNGTLRRDLITMNFN